MRFETIHHYNDETKRRINEILDNYKRCIKEYSENASTKTEEKND